MDVKRTNFVKENKEELIELLIEIANNNPRLSYY